LFYAKVFGHSNRSGVAVKLQSEASPGLSQPASRTWTGEAEHGPPLQHLQGGRYRPAWQVDFI
jgi:hypothetical protein